MKNSLGRLFLILLVFLHVEIFASTYEWNISANKKSVYVGEALHLKYTCRFNDKAELYSIDFNPVGDYKDYSVELLKESGSLVDGKKVNSYEFVAFFKKSGSVDFAFETVMKKTNEDSIKNTVLGRDNAFYEEFTKINIKQKNLHVEVLKTQTTLVGDFSLELKKDKQQVKAYEPYNMNITIKGNGNFNAIKPITFTIDGVKIFAEKVIKNIELTKDGYSGVWSQKFAFVGSKEFVVPELKIEYFNPNSKEKKVLHVDMAKVEVLEGYKKEELLDEVDEEFKINYDYFYYLFAFILGFLVSKIEFKKKKETHPSDMDFKEKVKNADSLKEVCVLLALNNRKKYEELILAIETKQVTSLNKVKKEVDLI